jgi:hypothetical protein
VVQQRRQHLGDYYQEIVKRPVLARVDSARTVVRAEVPDGLLRFPPRDFDGTVSIPAFAASETFTDVRGDRLNAPPHLGDVQQLSARVTRDQCVEHVCRPLGGVEDIEVAVCHARTVALSRDPSANKAFRFP